MTMDELKRIGLAHEMPLSNYPLCKVEEETVDHLLLKCSSFLINLVLIDESLWCAVGGSGFVYLFIT